MSPLIDLLCCGGFSIVLIGGFLGYAMFLPRAAAYNFLIADIVVLNALINWPHFMASYRLLYASRADVLEHKGASIYVPLILTGIALAALLTSGSSRGGSPFTNSVIVEIVAAVAAYLLAWHYTAQVWGMTASFSYISGVRIEKTERRLIRSSLHVLLVWHVLWLTVHNFDRLTFLTNQQMVQLFQIMVVVYLAWSAVAVASFIWGWIGFWRMWRRTGRVPPMRAVVPWGAIYCWYLLIYYYPTAFAFLQISHALQYLIFPLRVEVNRYDPDPHVQDQRKARRMGIYYVALVGIGVVVYLGPGYFFQGDDPDLGVVALLSAIISIHHYFIDGAIWKIRNPKVRKDLFAHLQLS